MNILTLEAEKCYPVQTKNRLQCISSWVACHRTDLAWGVLYIVVAEVNLSIQLLQYFHHSGWQTGEIRRTATELANTEEMIMWRQFEETHPSWFKIDVFIRSPAYKRSLLTCSKFVSDEYSTDAYSESEGIIWWIMISFFRTCGKYLIYSLFSSIWKAILYVV